LQLFHRVATELLQERPRQRDRHHRLADHSRRRHHADVAALVVRLHLLLRLQVDRVHRLLHRRDGLDGDADVDRLAIGHPACEAPRPVGQVPEAPAGVVDLVVELRPRPRNTLEPSPDLDEGSTPSNPMSVAPIDWVKLRISTPNCPSSLRATPPAATRVAVSRADERSSTLRTSEWPYFSAPARSA